MGRNRLLHLWLALLVVGALLVFPAAPPSLGAPLPLAGLPAEPKRQAEQWNLRQIGADGAWALTRGSPEIIVGVIDTGVDADHPELKGKVVAGRNFADNNDRTRDIDGHGTFVSGIIAAQGVEMWGVAPNVKIMPLRVFGGGTAYVDPANDWTGVAVATARALRWGVDNGARIFNISLGWPENVRELQEAIDYAYGKGALIFVASGNEEQDWVNGPPPVNYPAASRNAIAVTATNTRGEPAGYSNRGPHIQLSAPGGDIDAGSGFNDPASRRAQLIVGPRAGGGYVYESGTSFASPHAAGVAALIWSLNPTLTNTEVARILFETARKPAGVTGRSDSYGWGRVDAYRAVLAALPGPVALAMTAPKERADVSAPVEITGWAGALGELGPADVDVEIYLQPEVGGEGTLIGRATTGLPTPEIAELTGKPRLAAGGWRFLWNPAGTPKGRYRLTAVAISAGGDRVSRSVTIDVAGS